jgi:hypothetical protein
MVDDDARRKLKGLGMGGDPDLKRRYWDLVRAEQTRQEARERATRECLALAELRRIAQALQAKVERGADIREDIGRPKNASKAKSAPPDPVQPPAGIDDKEKLCPHSEDFRTLSWFGEPYPFTPDQAPCVRVWYEHWRTATRDVSDARVLEAAECESTRVSDVFKRSKAWRDKIIVEGDTRGTHRLREPTEPKPPERKRNLKPKRPSKK